MPRKSQISSSQGRSSQKSQSQRLTQLTLETSFSESAANIEDCVNDCVRYILQKAGQKLPFRKSDLKKNVVDKNFEAVIQKTTEILRNTYGFNLIICDESLTNKMYILSNSLPYINDGTETGEEIPEDVNKILLMLILSHIFMSNNCVGEASMKSFLQSLSIDMERKHPLFGNVKDYMTNLVKQKYLKVETDALSRKASYSWGPHAEKEISKHMILKFVCKMYKDCMPNAWTNQFEVAQEQCYENFQQENECMNGNIEADE